MLSRYGRPGGAHKTRSTSSCLIGAIDLIQNVFYVLVGAAIDRVPSRRVVALRGLNKRLNSNRVHCGLHRIAAAFIAERPGCQLTALPYLRDCFSAHYSCRVWPTQYTLIACKDPHSTRAAKWVIQPNASDKSFCYRRYGVVDICFGKVGGAPNTGNATG